MQGELLQLFPTPVGKLKLRALTTEENEAITIELSNTQKNVGNTVTVNRFLLDNPQLQTLKKDITDMVNQYYQMVYLPATQVQLYITTSWCNISYKGDFHHEHCHYNSLLSGTYYINVEESDSIVFKRGAADYGFLSLLTFPSDENQNMFNHASHKQEIEQNDLVIFPSMLNHMVAPLQREGPRISLSFNTFATGDFGSEINLTQLTLR